jgi:hypothetical protein
MSSSIQNRCLWARPRNANEAGPLTPGILLLTHIYIRVLSSEQLMSTHAYAVSRKKLERTD